MKAIGRIVLTALLCAVSLPLYSVDTLKISAFGLLPDSRVNATPYVNEAIKVCRDNPGTVLYFQRGRYDFWPQYSTEKVYYESNTTDNNPKRLAVFFEGVEGLTLDGGGSEFVMHDRMQPITLDGCRDMTLMNFSIDWDVPLMAQATVAAVGDGFFELILDARTCHYVLEKEKLFFTGEGWKSPVMGFMEFDACTGVISNGDRCLGKHWRDYTVEQVCPDRVRLSRQGGFERYPKPGNVMVTRLGDRDHAGIFLNESCNISLSDITIHHTAGLGILCQYSENLSFSRVKVVPNKAKGRFFSGHDDGIHAMGCKGYICISDCEWQYLMDDPVNIHGTCARITEILSPSTIKCMFMEHMSTGLRWGVFDDLVGFIDNSTLATVENNNVLSFSPLNHKEFIIETTRPFSSQVKAGMALENLTWTPDVEIRDCRFLSCRARGLLVSTPGKVVVENNFFASSGSAILIAGDANYWYESGAVRDVLIKGNTFHNSCLTSMYQFTEAIISIMPEIPNPDPDKTYHRNIRIEDNHFNPFDYPLLYATSVDGLTFSGNTIERSYEAPAWHARKAGITVDACKNVRISANKIVGDVLGRTISVENMNKKEVKLSNQPFFEVVWKSKANRPDLMK